MSYLRFRCRWGKRIGRLRGGGDHGRRLRRRVDDQDLDAAVAGTALAGGVGGDGVVGAVADRGEPLRGDVHLIAEEVQNGPGASGGELPVGGKLGGVERDV